MVENVYLKKELEKIRERYDFTIIDKTKSSLDRHEVWVAAM